MGKYTGKCQLCFALGVLVMIYYDFSGTAGHHIYCSRGVKLIAIVASYVHKASIFASTPYIREDSYQKFSRELDPLRAISAKWFPLSKKCFVTMQCFGWSSFGALISGDVVFTSTFHSSLTCEIIRASSNKWEKDIISHVKFLSRCVRSILQFVFSGMARLRRANKPSASDSHLWAAQYRELSIR